MSFKKDFVEKFEAKVLEAMDDITLATFGQEWNGWKDEDLRDILPVIRKQAERVFVRLTSKE